MAATCVDVCPRVACPPREAASDDIPLHRRLTCSVFALCILWFLLRSLWAAGSDGELTELQGRLRISRSPEVGCHINPKDSKPNMSHPSLRETGPQEEEGAAMGKLPAEGRGRGRVLCGSLTVWGVWEGGNLVVNRNRWASSQEKRWKKKKKTDFGRVVGMKAGKLREGEASSFLRWKTCL